MFVPSLRARCRAIRTAHDRLKLEKLVAVARAFVSCTSLLAISIDPTEPTSYAHVAYTTLSAYAVASLLTMLMVRVWSRVPRWLPLISHSTDVCVAAGLTLFTEGPNSPFFIFFAYTLLVAAYRWGFFATVATAVTSVLLLGGEAVLIGSWPAISTGFVEGQFEIHRLIMRMLYLLLTGLLLGFLGEKEQSRQSEASIVALVTRRAQMSAGMHGMLESVLGSVVHLFGASRALVALHDSRTGRAWLWTAVPVSGSDRMAISGRELDTVARALYFGGNSTHTWFAGRRRRRIDVTALDADGNHVAASDTIIDSSFWTTHRCRSVLSVPVDLKGRVSGRVYLLDAQVGLDRQSAVSLAQRLATDIAPAAHNVHRLRRVRSRSEAIERARIARELHDGVLQSLSAVEMRLDVVRRTVENSAPSAARELASIQDWCRDEARTLRLMTRAMQPARPHGQDLTEVVERFERETGISTRLISDDGRQRLSARTRRELARIVHEGLHNVRKHSGAGHVLVRAATVDGRWKVSIEDDGRGFPFAGKKSHSELDAQQQGPFVIKERVRALRGKLSVESRPGKGSRLELDVPMRG